MTGYLLYPPSRVRFICVMRCRLKTGRLRVRTAFCSGCKQPGIWNLYCVRPLPGSKLKTGGTPQPKPLLFQTYRWFSGRRIPLEPHKIWRGWIVLQVHLIKIKILWPALIYDIEHLNCQFAPDFDLNRPSNLTSIAQLMNFANKRHNVATNWK